MCYSILVAAHRASVRSSPAFVLASLVRAMLVLFCFQLSGSAHLFAHAAAAFQDETLSEAESEREDEDDDCPPGCPTCCHCSHGGSVPLGAAIASASPPPERGVARFGVEFPERTAPDAFIGSVFRPPRA